MPTDTTLHWERLYDDNDNSYYEANSPYHDDEVPFKWRLRQRIRDDCIEWYEDHDAELLGDTPPRTWQHAGQGMYSIEDSHRMLVTTLKEEVSK